MTTRVYVIYALLAVLSVLSVAQASLTVSQISNLLQTVEKDLKLNGTMDTGPAGILNIALKEIQSVLDAPIFTPQSTVNATKIDTHSHFVPAFYALLVPNTAGSPTPSWNVSSQLSFMAQYGIARSIISIGAPGASACFNNTSPYCPPNEEIASIVLARLINLYAAALAAKYPKQYSFFVCLPLPYTQFAIAEVDYAMNTLGAAGIGGFSNHEGLYIGNAQFTPFFQHVNSSIVDPVVFIHPNTPCLNIGSYHIDANPTLYKDGVVELYFEDARGFMDLVLTQTVANFSAIDWLAPHAGGSFPSIIDRMLTAYGPIAAQAHAEILSRFWWDTAGPTFPHQVLGLLAYNVSASKLTFGSDYPYVPAVSYPSSIAAQTNAAFLTAQQKQDLFTNNAAALFGNRI